jgi:hypothetical protein
MPTRKEIDRALAVLCEQADGYASKLMVLLEDHPLREQLLECLMQEVLFELRRRELN